MAECNEMSMDVRRKHNRPARGWVIAPTFGLAMEEWRITEQIMGSFIDTRRSSKQDKKIVMWDGSEMEFKSADSKSETLRGAGLDWAFLTEASRIPREAWEQGIRPALSDRLGRAIFGSTPKGRNWFYEMFLRGLGNDTEYKSWQLPTNTRPSFSQEEWETLKETLPEMVFKQEFNAEFLEDSAAVFRGMGAIIDGTMMEPIANHKYLMGADLGRTVDFTVLFVIDMLTKHIVHFERFNQLEWPFQKKRITALSKKYNDAFVWLDSSGLGDPIEHDLRRANVRCQGIKFTNQTKKELVEFLSIAIEQKMFTYPRIDVLLNELSAFEYQMLPSGDIRYCAPEGMHDDCVISLALCLWGLRGQMYKKSKIIDKKPYDTLSLKDQAFWERWEKQTKPTKQSTKSFTDEMTC